MEPSSVAASSTNSRMRGALASRACATGAGNDEIGDEEAEIDVVRAGISYYFK